MNKEEIISRHAQALKGQVGFALAIDECEDIMASMMNEAINYSQCCTEFADGKCQPMVNADWTYLRCECGKRFEPRG